ncbi:MAG TPA: hypothetical protein ENJ93_04130 [Chloroflexi bacterium]|nr:hypothetical protein [Chloroflexota bacterium]
MRLADLTKEITALSRIEKLQLIEAISKMLLEEENPARYFEPDKVYPVFTPLGQEKASAQLEQLLQQQTT